MRIIILPLISLLSLNGCAIVFDGIANELVSAAIDGSRSKKKENHKAEKTTTINLSNGDSVTLNSFHVEGDTLFGIKEDYSNAKFPTKDVTSIKIDNGFETKPQRLKKTAKEIGLFMACVSAGMIVGAGTGYVVPLTGHSNSSISGIDQFTSYMSGMLIGGLAGIAIYAILSNEEKLEKPEE